jgi:hypothetical protein
MSAPVGPSHPESLTEARCPRVRSMSPEEGQKVSHPRLLDKSTFVGNVKQANDTAFSFASRFTAYKLNIVAGAGDIPAVNAAAAEGQGSSTPTPSTARPIPPSARPKRPS